MVGYPPHQKGYKLFDSDIHEIFVARDVIFHDNIFPFKQSAHNSSPHPLVSFHDKLTKPYLLAQPLFIPSTAEIPSIFSSTTSNSLISLSGLNVFHPLMRTRTTYKPNWLKYFVASTCITFSGESSNLAFFANIAYIHEPTYYSQAKQDPIWVEAMNNELFALEINDTWDLTNLPPH